MGDWQQDGQRGLGGCWRQLHIWRKSSQHRRSPCRGLNLGGCLVPRDALNEIKWPRKGPRGASWAEGRERPAWPARAARAKSPAQRPVGTGGFGLPR